MLRAAEVCSPGLNPWGRGCFDSRVTCFPRTSWLALLFGLILLSGLSLLSGAESRGMALPSVPGAVWWKGNLHTHTLWSDGDDFPEMVADWYKNHGYHFLGLSDHNLLQRGEKWVTVTNLHFKELTVDRYRARWGNFWVQARDQNGREQVRLKTFDEFRPMLEEKGKFLLIRAMERGDFYSSTGVELLDVQRDRHRLTVQVDPEPGVTYTIRFIGTPRGFNSQSIPIIAHDGRPYATTRHYSSEVGKVLREVYGTSASYESDGSELYVRAKVISSKLKEDAQTPDERQMAWTQPAVLAPN